MKYEVKTEFVFGGTVIIEADSHDNARELVRDNISLVMGMPIETTLGKETCNWEFDPHAETITGRVRRAE